LGGKLGAEITDIWKHSTVGAMWSVSLDDMVVHLGEDGRRVYELIRGNDFSEVIQRSTNRSMMYVTNNCLQQVSKKFFTVSWKS
jgi:hypothetical protein